VQFHVCDGAGKIAALSPDLLSTIDSAKWLPFKLWGDFLSGSWDRCQGGLSGHALYKECVQTEPDNDWMPMLEINAGIGRERQGDTKGEGRRHKTGMLLRVLIFMRES
jgi:hypothetical protein